MQYKLTERAKEYNHYLNLDFHPKRATERSAGYDLFACIPEDIVLFPGEIIKIGTGVHIWIGSEDLPYRLPIDGMAGLLMPRSSVKGIKLTNTIGLIDEDYQGEYIASCENTQEDIITIRPGQKFMQVIFVPVFLPKLELVEEFSTNTVRANGGFGHTGE